MKKTLRVLSLALFALVVLAGASIASAAGPAPAPPTSPDAEAPAAAPAPAEPLDLVVQPAHTPVAAVPAGDEIGRMACSPPECGAGDPCPGGLRCIAKCCV